MARVENNDLNIKCKDSAVIVPHTPEEDFAARIYRFVDEAADRELFSLLSKKGIRPSCMNGCYECCNQYILINRTEAHVLGQFIRRELSVKETHSLKHRTYQWHVWNEDRPERHLVPDNKRPGDLSGRRPFCPLLVNGSCRAYAMRPIICRTHFVCSSPSFCRFLSNQSVAVPRPTALTSVVTATNRFANRLKKSINKNSPDFSREIMLLPHWLAIEMAWDFAIAI